MVNFKSRTEQSFLLLIILRIDRIRRMTNEFYLPQSFRFIKISAWKSFSSAHCAWSFRQSTHFLDLLPTPTQVVHTVLQRWVLSNKQRNHRHEFQTTPPIFKSRMYRPQELITHINNVGGRGLAYGWGLWMYYAAAGYLSAYSDEIAHNLCKPI